MIFTIFCIVALIVLIISVIHDNFSKNKIGDILGVAFGTFIFIGDILGVAFGTFIFWLFGMFIGGILIDSSTDLIRKTPKREPVYSLDVKNSMSGSFFLGCGYVSGSVNYIMFIDNKGGKQILQVDAENTIVYEDENVHPYIIRKCYYEWDYHTVNLWFHQVTENSWKPESVYALHVPKGTIKINTNQIDLSTLK